MPFGDTPAERNKIQDTITKQETITKVQSFGCAPLDFARDRRGRQDGSKDGERSRTIIKQEQTPFGYWCLDIICILYLGYWLFRIGGTCLLGTPLRKETRYKIQ